MKKKKKTCISDTRSVVTYLLQQFFFYSFLNFPGSRLLTYHDHVLKYFPLNTYFHLAEIGTVVYVLAVFPDLDYCDWP